MEGFVRYLLSLILVISFSSVSYSSGNFTCDINDIVTLASSNEANIYRGTKDKELDLKDTIQITYDDRNIIIVVMNENRTRVKYPQQFEGLGQILTEYQADGNLYFRSDDNYLNFQTSTDKYYI